MRRLHFFLAGSLVGILIGIALAFCYLQNEKKEKADGFLNYVTYRTAIDQVNVQRLAEGKSALVLSVLDECMVMDWARIILAKRNHVDTKDLDQMYVRLRLYFAKHPEAWNWLPDKKLTMLPGDPILPRELNVRALIQTDLNGDNPDNVSSDISEVKN